METVGATFNLITYKSCEGSDTVRKYGADSTSVAGGGLATDHVKVSVALAYRDEDLRDKHPTCPEELSRDTAFAGDASITAGMGLETNVGLATIHLEKKSKTGYAPVDESATFCPLTTNLAHITISLKH